MLLSNFSIISLGQDMKSQLKSTISHMKDGRTLLHLVAKKGKLEVYKNLVKMTHDKNPKDKHGWTPLHLAAQKGDLEMYIFIAGIVEDKNPKADLKANLWTPLHCAAKNGHFKMVELICSIVVEIHPKDTNQKTPRNIAQIHGRSDICDLYMYIWMNNWHHIPNYYFKTYIEN